MRADVAKDVDGFPSLGVMFDVKREDPLERDVAFPNPRMPLHLAYAQRWMERRMFGPLLETTKYLRACTLTSTESMA